MITASSSSSSCTVYDADKPIDFRHTLAYSSLFRQDITKTLSVVKAAPSVTLTTSSVQTEVCATDGLTATFQQNSNLDSAIKFQHFSSRLGYMRTFPGRVMSTPFDPRSQKWFASSAAGPRDVVILLDNSASTSRLTRWSLMQSAARSVLDTLDANDRVSLMYFNDTVTRATCFRDFLVRATTQNLAEFYRELNNPSVVSLGETNVETALTAAANMFLTSANSNQSTGCNKVVVMITDGQPTLGDLAASAPVLQLSQMNAQLFVYAIGQDISDAMQSVVCGTRGFFYSFAEKSASFAPSAGQYYLQIAGMANNRPHLPR